MEEDILIRCQLRGSACNFSVFPEHRCDRNNRNKSDGFFSCAISCTPIIIISLSDNFASLGSPDGAMSRS